MMPMSPPPGAGPMPPEGPQGPSPEGGQNIEMQLVQLLRQAMMLAQKNGIDFKALVMKVVGSGEAPAAPPMP